MRVQYFVNKDSAKWFRKQHTQNICTIQQNLVTEKSGIKGVAKNAKLEMKSWKIFFIKPMDPVSEFEHQEDVHFVIGPKTVKLLFVRVA